MSDSVVKLTDATVNSFIGFVGVFFRYTRLNLKHHQGKKLKLELSWPQGKRSIGVFLCNWVVCFNVD